MSISDAFDKTIDWMMEGSMPVAVAKQLAIASIPVGAIMAPLIYLASENIEELQQTFENLDGRPTVVFQSVAACANKGYLQAECERSRQKALDISEEFGNTVSYSSGSECINNHEKCDQNTWMQPVIIRTGQTTIVNQIPHTAYTPPVVAWQAAADDLQVAVPLYSGPEQEAAVRKDGRIFDLVLEP